MAFYTWYHRTEYQYVITTYLPDTYYCCPKTHVLLVPPVHILYCPKSPVLLVPPVHTPYFVVLMQQRRKALAESH